VKPIDDILKQRSAKPRLAAAGGHLLRRPGGDEASAPGRAAGSWARFGHWRTLAGGALGFVKRSLSGRLLLLTLIYVLITEVVIMVPALGRYYRSLLEARVESSEIAVLPLTEVDVNKFSGALQQELLARAGADAVALERRDVHAIYLNKMPAGTVQDIDLKSQDMFGGMYQALRCIAFGGNRTLRIISPTRIAGAEQIEVVVNASTIRDPLLAYAGNLVVVALAISLLTALLVFASLYIVFVRPMRQLTRGMVRFQENPDDPGRIIAPTGRKDEIGLAERELASMQRTIYGSLQQRARLAALGTAVAKIQHDLRNMLSTAQLASDRLSRVEDPAVQKLAPRLVSSLGHAVALATNTLRYGRADEKPPERRGVNLLALIEEVREAAIAAPVDADPALEVEADPEQLFRILLNLARNAAEATALVPRARIAISARHESGLVTIEIADNGAGIPAPIRDRLFQPFALSGHAGGTGLGLAIARELARAHGGDVELISTSSAGTLFRVTIPDKI